MVEEVKRKRQARGEARMVSLLAAAENVFARVGYSKATTNEIAAEADVSPATLYQFFKNKEELANELAQKYVELMQRQHDHMDMEAISKLPMRKMVEALLLPLFEFHKMHPAFMALLCDAPLSEETRRAKLAMSSKFVENMTRLLTLRNPKGASEAARWSSEIALLLFRTFISEIHLADAQRQARLIDTLIEVIAKYLQ